ncbi:MAG: precorrin-3B C(17)-methyltransferase [Magnetococcales bacterium]|nr:precorrin-3B C(17)-methyltransferase [Magnetococcales bacterium]
MISSASRPRRIALIAITKRGVSRAVSLARLWEGEVDLFAMRPHHQTVDASGVRFIPFDKPLRDHMPDWFQRYGALVLFLSAGAVTRLIAPHLRDKRQDPAVLALDEGGGFVIPLLSGHVGGANDLARQVAELLGAAPVISTATDSSGTLPVDVLGQSLGWRVEGEPEILKRVAALLVNGDPVALVQSHGSRSWRRAFEPFPANITTLAQVESADPTHYQALLLISRDPVGPELAERWAGRLVCYQPPKGQGAPLAVGLGCDRGACFDTMVGALRGGLASARLLMEDVQAFTTIDRKKNEPCMRQLALERDLDLSLYPAAALAKVTVPNPSETVLKYMGTPSVSEAAALLEAGGGLDDLLVEKYRFKGPDGKNATVSMARIRGEKGVASASEGSSSETAFQTGGELAIVGIGPGDAWNMTARARDAIHRADVVVGYKTYLDLIAPMLVGKETAASGMRGEVERCGDACRRALNGQRVALISSGDAGIYGMAGLAYEVLFEAGWSPDNGPPVMVIPGVTALSACASLAGAPLTHDFCAVSLSDLLTPWGVIEARLEAAAQADFVTALYNPKSRKRVTHLLRAVEIFLSHRQPETPVAVVTAAGRTRETLVLATLGTLAECDVGMQTTVLIGNSRSFVRHGRMVTPRGYGDKYGLDSV